MPLLPWLNSDLKYGNFFAYKNMTENNDSKQLPVFQTAKEKTGKRRENRVFGVPIQGSELEARFRQLFQCSLANNYAQVTSKYSSIYY